VRSRLLSILCGGLYLRPVRQEMAFLVAKPEAHFVLQMAFPGPAPRVLGDQPSKPFPAVQDLRREWFLIASRAVAERRAQIGERELLEGSFHPAGSPELPDRT
jgi:hypothetical protein